MFARYFVVDILHGISIIILLLFHSSFIVIVVWDTSFYMAIQRLFNFAFVHSLSSSHFPILSLFVVVQDHIMLCEKFFS